ncbi:hypothetical protein CH274_13540 [Rhodococcus sp. 06-418-5]|nr:hypothetical protein CH274_13540 [Rhodococcus sp. 06-418-5]
MTAALQNDTRRLWVKLISKRAFRDYIDFRGETNASLARKAKVSPALIALLRSEKKAARWSCKPSNARAIEVALNAPPGSLFSAQLVGGLPNDTRLSA